jgi:HEPN domain-containing protein
MTAEELLLDETHAWLVRARNDLEAARLMIGAQLYAEALFHCQQAAEKALKAFLAYHQRPFRKTRTMLELKEEIAAIDPSLESIVILANALSDYAWRFRYPGAPYEPDALEATEALRKAEMTVREIEQRLPAGV